MRYVLIAKTRGDELISSQQKVIAESSDRAKLEAFKDKRASERSQWLKANSATIPWWQENGIISSETIEEIAEI